MSGTFYLRCRQLRERWGYSVVEGTGEKDLEAWEWPAPRNASSWETRCVEEREPLTLIKRVQRKICKKPVGLWGHGDAFSPVTQKRVSVCCFSLGGHGIFLLHSGYQQGSIATEIEPKGKAYFKLFSSSSSSTPKNWAKMCLEHDNVSRINQTNDGPYTEEHVSRADEPLNPWVGLCIDL